MSKLYILLFALVFSFAACNESSDSNEASADENTEEVSEATATDEASTSELGYETTVVTADLPSPRKEMTASIGDATLKINYGSPSVKGRTIFGELEPYDAVWRMGANEATTFEVSSDVKVQGETLAAGKYGLFTIPTEAGNWTVIFNSVSDQWGAYKYSEKDDVLRVNATLESREEASETMDFVMEDGKLVWKWDTMALPIEVEL